MRKKILFFALMSVMALGLAACSDDDGTDTSEYHDWQARNDAYFSTIRTLALDSMLMARATFGSSWEEHSAWRAYASYSLSDAGIALGPNDSVFVQILRQGTGTASPYLNDSVRVFYRGRLIPSESYPDGYVFSHSGQSSIYSEIFNPQVSVPSIHKTSSFVKGLATALLRMHIGDRWRVYIPYKLAYNETERGAIPAYSDLIFEVQLVSFYRNGASVPSWN